MPSTKNGKYAVLRPILSESDAQKIRPSELNSEMSPTSPAADATNAAFCTVVIAVPGARPSSFGPNTSCSIGLAIAITPMPAVTFVHSTPQISQNCGVFHAWFRCTFCRVIIPFERSLAGGYQPLGATRKPNAPADIAMK